MKKTLKTKSLSLIVCVCLLAGAAMAVLPAIKTQAITGGGASASDPYLISTEADLIAIRTTSPYNATVGKYYRLTTDITLTAPWTPFAFGGTFEGNGKTISGLEVDIAGNDAGLFSILNNSARVQNLTVKTGEAGIKAVQYAGIIAGRSTDAGVVIENCVTDGYIFANYRVGGILGASFISLASGLTACNIRRCTSSATITSANGEVGGILGTSSGGIVSECVSTGSIIMTAGFNYAGGIVGSSSALVERCSWSGYIKTNGSAGGIAGSIAWGKIIDCFTSGFIDTPANAGFIGGLAGNANGNCMIKNSIAMTKLNTTHTVSGGIAGGLGNNTPGYIENCYYNNDNLVLQKSHYRYSGTATDVYPLPTAAFIGKLDYFEEFDKTAWDVNPDSFPYLKWQKNREGYSDIYQPAFFNYEYDGASDSVPARIGGATPIDVETSNDVLQIDISATIPKGYSNKTSLTMTAADTPYVGTVISVSQSGIAAPFLVSAARDRTNPNMLGTGET
ncbi:MAG: hypothetical protein FWD16_03085, partial [Clostridia bacterium]|nr:hypothetical protein [Clostridia bacterium]